MFKMQNFGIIPVLKVQVQTVTCDTFRFVRCRLYACIYVNHLPLKCACGLANDIMHGMFATTTTTA